MPFAVRVRVVRCFNENRIKNCDGPANVHLYGGNTWTVTEQFTSATGEVCAITRLQTYPCECSAERFRDSVAINSTRPIYVNTYAANRCYDDAYRHGWFTTGVILLGFMAVPFLLALGIECWCRMFKRTHELARDIEDTEGDDDDAL